VLAVTDCTLTAKDSGIEITAQVFSIATVRDGVITRMDEYNSRPEALEAVGCRSSPLDEGPGGLARKGGPWRRFVRHPHWSRQPGAPTGRHPRPYSVPCPRH
jgi:hypothetical protein